MTDDCCDKIVIRDAMRRMNRDRCDGSMRGTGSDDVENVVTSCWTRDMLSHVDVVEESYESREA
jgi:hypothetical protein